MSKVKQIRPPSASTHGQFGELEREMMVWLNALTCASVTLSGSGVIDSDDEASIARSTIHVCNKNLRRLMEQLESWEMRLAFGALAGVVNV